MSDGASKRWPLVALVVAIAAAAAGFWYLRIWEPRSHIPAEIVYQYRTQFDPGQLEPGYTLISVGRNVEDPTMLMHRVQVPPALAGELVMLSANQRGERVAAIACPDAEHEIWQQLTSRQDIAVQLFTEKGEFAVVRCRSEVR
jgi:hypothetical protein